MDDHTQALANDITKIIQMHVAQYPDANPNQHLENIISAVVSGSANAVRHYIRIVDKVLRESGKHDIPEGTDKEMYDQCMDGIKTLAEMMKKGF